MKQAIPKKQARMLARLKGASLSSTALKGKPHKPAAWDKMLMQAGCTRSS